MHLERDDVETAAHHQQLARAHGDHAGLPQNAYRWRVATARLLHVRGERDAAYDLLAEADARYHTDFSPAVRPVPALRARLQLQDGDVDAAVAWARQAGLAADDELTYVHEYGHLTLARTLLATADGSAAALASAVDLLERLRAAAGASRRDAAALEADVLLALAHDAAGDRVAATTLLGRALTTAAPEGYVRLFLDEGDAMVALLRGAELTEPAAAHARLVLAAASAGADAGVAPRHTTTLVDPLSVRELDVLRLLRSDLSGPEIARELLVSLNTLRTHTKSIYTKLGANSRRTAIRRADELGL